MLFPIIDSKRGNTPENAARCLREFLRSREIPGILLGLSGGADSVLTFHLLRMAAEYLHPRGGKFRLGVCHVNFRLRGEESMRDENFVRDLLEAFPGGQDLEIIPYFTKYDTEKYCRENSLSIEMGARELRHNLFRRIAVKDRFSYLATGHNADDNEETLLINLLRGSGAKGLKGMLPISPGPELTIIRPLLDFSKKEIIRLLNQIPYPEEFNRNYKGKYITDSSNLDSDFRRNFLRNEVIPLLEKRWKGVHTALQLSLSIVAEEDKIVTHAIERELAKSCLGNLLPWPVISRFPSPISLINAWIARMSVNEGKKGKQSFTHIAREICDHIPTFGVQPPTFGKTWILPDGSIVTTPEGLRYQHNITESINELAAVYNKFRYETTPPVKDVVQNGEISENLINELLNIIRHAPLTQVYLPGTLDDYYFRFPKRGDRIRMMGKRTENASEKKHAGSKLLSSVMGEAEIPIANRPTTAILCRKSDDAIVWVPNIRRAGISLITPEMLETMPILHILPKP